MTNFFSNVGEILGPILGGLLCEYFGFSYGFLFMSLICLGYFILYAFVCDIFSLFNAELRDKLGVFEMADLNETYREGSGLNGKDKK